MKAQLHHVMAFAAALALLLLTYSRVWRVVGVGQTIISFAFLIIAGIDHFKRGRGP